MVSAAALTIKVLHILFILFYVLIPFVPMNVMEELHILHLATGPLLFVHWWLNSDECCLTQMECAITGKPKGDSFFYNLVSPIYHQADDCDIRRMVWIVAILLWLITVAKFIRQPESLKTFWRRVKDVMSGRAPRV